MVRHVLFIGLHERDVAEVERQLHSRIFTEQHYHRVKVSLFVSDLY